MAADEPRPEWAGTRKCGRPGARGPCQSWEIDGLDACLRHVDDEYLEEAEAITGRRRCRQCSALAPTGAREPLCANHGAQEATRGVEQSAAIRLASIMRENGTRLLNPEPVGNPLDELLGLAAEIKAGKELLREAVMVLWETNTIRYAHSKAGEQLRVEILLYERALERFAKILIDIAKLKIEERLAGIRQQTADMLERALDAALEESGVGLEGKAAARDALHRHLRVVA